MPGPKHIELLAKAIITLLANEYLKLKISILGL